MHEELPDQCSLLLKNSSLLPEACYCFKTHFTLCLGKSLLNSLGTHHPRGLWNLLLSTPTGDRLVTISQKARELFLRGWRWCLKAQAICKSFYCKLHLALSLPPPSLLASLYRPNRTRKSRSEGGSQAHCNVCRRIVSLWLRLQPWQLPNGPIFPYPLLPKGGHLNARGERRETHRREGREDGPVKKSANNATPPLRRPVSRAWREERGNSLGIMQPCGTHAPEGEGEGGGGRGAPQARQVGLPAARLRGEG